MSARKSQGGLAQLARDVLERHQRSPELAVNEFVSWIRAESGGMLNELIPDDAFRQYAIDYLRNMASNLDRSPE